jgi:hypothetical protein
MYKVRTRDSLNFLGDAQTKDVHFLRNERSACRLDEVLAAGRGVGFSPDSLSQAKLEGYAHCQHCRQVQSIIAPSSATARF